MTKSIGVLGTAKNTGKTTTLAAILAALGRRGLRSGLTSIGYDGEDLDNVTGLPKPRITVGPGDVVATAASCFEGAEARLRLVCETGVHTPLGPVLIGEALEGGRVVLAGPATGASLREVVRRMEELGPALVMVDGALNRMVPLMETDGIVLATGAARSIDPARLAREARAFEDVFRMTRLGEAGASEALQGLVALPALRRLAEGPGAARRIVFRNPAQLLLAGESEGVIDFLGRAREAGVELAAEKVPPLLAVTTNPFYPAFRKEGGGFYAAAAIDAGLLLDSLRAELRAPVSDIVREGPGACVAALNAGLGLWN